MRILNSSLFLLLVLALVSESCTHEAKQSAANLDLDRAAAEIEEDQKATGQKKDVAVTVVAFTFSDKFPMLSEILKGNGALLAKVESFAEKAITKKGLVNEAAILALVTERDEEIIPSLDPIFEAMDEEFFYENFQKIEAELNNLGITMVTAEGMFIRLGPSDFLTETMRLHASEAFNLYQAFRYAKTSSQGGEYPYSNMRPYIEMLVTGEKIGSLGDAEVYQQKIEQDAQMALEALADIHIVHDTDQGSKSVLYYGTSTDYYPYMSELRTTKEFLESEQSSKYKEVLRKIVENPSEITHRPEKMYLLVKEWADSREAARSKVFFYLSAGQDIPHYLAVRKGNGSDSFAVVYRFFEDEQKAIQTYVALEKEGNSMEMVLVSPRNGILYQTGI